MKKNKSNKKINLYILYITIIIAIFFIMSIIRGLHPFGNKTIIKMDFGVQYYPMLVETYNRAHNGSSLLYSFNEGLGMPLYRNAINYYLSPLNVLFMIIKDHILAIHLIIFLKIMLIGLSTLYYLKNKFKSNSVLLLIPALCFSLCGWVNAYIINIMWLDALIFIPLITLGIENLINNRKYKLYIFSLSGIIISNYYMGYMLCIYSTIYFFFYCLYKNREGNIKYKINEFSRNLLYFMGTSFISVLLSCIVLLPVVGIKNSMNEKMFYMDNPFKFNIIDIFSSNMMLTNPTVLAMQDTQAPNLYTSVFAIMMLIPFILNKKIEKRTKIIYILLFASIISIMCVSYFDYIINIFHIPAGFPYRYSYMYSFILIIILAYQLLKYEESNKWNYILSLIFIIGIIISIYIFKSDKINNNYLIYSLIYIIIYLIIILFIKKRIAMPIIILLVASELAITFNYSLGNLYTQDELYKIYYEPINEDIYKPNNNEFFRYDSMYNGRSVPLMSDYYSISSSSSMNYSKVYYLMNNIGVETDYACSNAYSSGSVLSEMLFGIKYVSYHNHIRTNNHTLPIMYAIDSKLDRELEATLGIYRESNKVVKDLYNIDDFYTKTPYKSKSIIYEDDNFIAYKYIYPNNTSVNINYSNVAFMQTGGYSYTIYISDFIKSFDYKYYILSRNPKMIKVENNEVIVGYVKDDVNEDYIKAYSYDEKKLKELYDYLNRYPIELKEFKEDYIEGTIKVDQDMSMMSSIPYDEGWHVYIDDKEVDTYGQYDALLGFDIPKGEHNIKLKYSISYLKEGSIVSLITLVSIISFELIKKHKKNKA